jgi:choline dehydrogenase-like flavoprotein
MKYTPEVQAALDRCLAARAANPDATVFWFLHHEVPLEKLTEPFENRLNYILEHKPEHELVARLNNLRPASREVAALDTEYRTRREALDTEYRTRWEALDTEYRTRRDALYTEYRTRREALYRAEVPLGTWDGISIFR